MQPTAIIELVQDRTGNESDTVANDMIIAVLETLAERDLGGAHSNFAAQLPNQFGTILSNADPQNQQDFNANEFVQRVAQRADISEEQADNWTRATLSALVQSVSAGERSDFLAALPNDFAPYAKWDV